MLYPIGISACFMPAGFLFLANAAGRGQGQDLKIVVAKSEEGDVDEMGGCS